MEILDDDAAAVAEEAIRSGKFYVKLKVTFGPELLDRATSPSKRELAAILQDEARAHSSFVTTLLGHMAEHLEEDVKRGKGSDPGPLDVVIGYRACGSCTPQDGVNQGMVCWWESGHTSCEIC